MVISSAEWGSRGPLMATGVAAALSSSIAGQGAIAYLARCPAALRARAARTFSAQPAPPCTSHRARSALGALPAPAVKAGGPSLEQRLLLLPARLAPLARRGPASARLAGRASGSCWEPSLLGGFVACC